MTLRRGALLALLLPLAACVACTAAAPAAPATPEPEPAAASAPPNPPRPTHPVALPTPAERATAKIAAQVERYQVRLDSSRLTHSEILKTAAASSATGKLTDGQVGAIRSAARRTDLEINIATSLLGLYASGHVTIERVDRAFSELDSSLRTLVGLRNKYAKGKSR